MGVCISPVTRLDIFIFGAGSSRDKVLLGPLQQNQRVLDQNSFLLFTPTQLTLVSLEKRDVALKIGVLDVFLHERMLIVVFSFIFPFQFHQLQLSILGIVVHPLAD